jgi:hypothetical protein
MSTRFVADRSKTTPCSPDEPEALGFYPCPHQLRIDLHRLGATEKLKNFMHFLVDLTAGQRTLFVLLSQRDIRFGPRDKDGQRQPWLTPGINSFTTIGEIIAQAKRLGLVEERNYGTYGTGLALHRHYWALMLALAPNLAPKWEVRLPGANTPWPRYDAERDPLIDSCQLVPLIGAAGETKQHARSNEWSDLPEPENIACSNDWSSEGHRSLQWLERAGSTCTPAIGAASDAPAEDEPGAESCPVDTASKDTHKYQDTPSHQQASEQDIKREETSLIE